VLLDLNRFSSDGATFGDGDLYGLSQMGEIVGMFYNREKVPQPPATFAELESQLAEAKSAGDVPISFGNLDKWPGIHEFQAVQNVFAPSDQVRDFVFARDGASFTTPENEEAAKKLQEWAEKGYFTKNFNGVGYDPAYQQFSKGAGPFLIAGTWLLRDLTDTMGDNLGFMLVPGAEEGASPQALGGESLPFAITSKSEHPDVAAAYIDFITNGDAATVLAETGNLPAMPVDESAIPQGLPSEVFAAWGDLSESDGLLPYLDYTTPTFYDDISSAIQVMLAGKDDPAQFTAGVEEAFRKFADSR
jgi:raffinose/stachyose/melibiose transport system substrate-binding protein